jgi:hypothetical protein
MKNRLIPIIDKIFLRKRSLIDGIKARGEKGNYSTQRVKFNSNNCS